MARAPVPAALALLLVLAGCSALPGDGPPGTTLAPGDTTVEAGDAATTGYGETATPAPDRILPGLTADGVTDVEALVDEHRNRLANTSYTLRATRTVESPYGKVESESIDAAFAGEPGRFRWTYQERDPDARPDLRYRAWGNGTHLHRDFDRGGRDQLYEVIRGDGTDLATDRYLLAERTQDETLLRLFSAFAVEDVDRRRSMDGPRYRLLSRTVVDPAALTGDPGTGVTNASLVALVDSDGVVRWLSVEYDVRRAGGPEHRRYDLRVIRVGTTSVERPEWVNTSAPTVPSDGQP